MKKRILSLFLLFSLVLTGCLTPQTKESDFNAFCMELFRSYAASDSLTLNYTVMSPGKYGIKNLPNGFAPFSVHDTKKAQISIENSLEKLHSFNKRKLSFEDELLYDTVESSLSMSLEETKMVSYEYSFDPSNGIQAQLPVLLSEFILYDKEDFSQYFSLLESIPAYFKSLTEFEYGKIKTKTLPCATTIRHTINQCNEFVNSSGTDAIAACFEKSIKKVSFFSSSEKKELIQKHKNLLEEKIIPAYKSLIYNLQKLCPYAKKDGAIASYPGGNQYYEFLVKKETGSSKSSDQLFEMLKKRLANAEQTLASIAAASPSSYLSCEKYTTKYKDAKTILVDLKKGIRSDFPTLSKQTCRIRTVDTSLENFLSPAFYLTPPIDSQTANVIYLNNAKKYRHQNLYATLAHEGYPGHLFQNCYFRQKSRHPLRYVLNFPAYTEGYATYAEIYSYQFLNASKEETAILQNNAISSLCLYALCDIGIHKKHWNPEKLASFLTNHGVLATDQAKAIYEAIIDSPASYLPYTVGYLEIEEIRKNFQTAAKKEYTPLLFHTLLLDIGPTSFTVLNRKILESEWVQ